MPPDARGRGPAAPDAGAIYLEFMRHGNAVTATAIDPVSGREASATGPVAARADVERLAVGKLRRLLGLAGKLGDEEAAQTKTPPGEGRGIVV